MAHYLGRCLLVLCGISCALLLVEGARRIDNRVRRGIPFFTNPRSLWDDRRGWVGREHVIGPTSSNPILVLGDSFTEGLTVSSESMWFAYLQREHPETQLIAYGGLGYGTLQELIVLEDYLKGGMHPSLVVVQLCSNDIINNYYPLEVSSYAQRPPAPRPYVIPQIRLLPKGVSDASNCDVTEAFLSSSRSWEKICFLKSTGLIEM
jgi:hypothetical protein